GSAAFAAGNASVPFGAVVSVFDCGGGGGDVPGIPNVCWVTWLTCPLASRVLTSTRYVPPAPTPWKTYRQPTDVAGALALVHAANAGRAVVVPASHEQLLAFHHIPVPRSWIDSSTLATAALSVAVPVSVTGASGSTAWFAGPVMAGGAGLVGSFDRASEGSKTWIRASPESVT